MEMEERNNKIEEYNAKVLARLVIRDFPRKKDGSIHGKFKNLTGQIFGRLTVTGYAGQTKIGGSSKYYWTQCSCQSDEKLALSTNLVTGNTTSCGCYHIESATSHGLGYNPWYSIAKGQQQRMTNPNHSNYPDYGGRGLIFGEGMETVEDRIRFYCDKFGPAPIKGMQMDRIDNNRGYAKDNVRLVSVIENSMNRRNSHLHTCEGLITRVYNAWRHNKRKGRLCDEWAADSKVFMKGIGGEIPDGKYLARYDMGKPFGPDNFYFSDKRQ